jgi:elongation factor G
MAENKKYPLEKIRNIGIIAHIDAGKTTTTETILYYTGKIHRLGEIDAGDTQMDWMDQEKERGITIQSAATTCFWNDCRVNIIDTPGHVDFTAEVERSLRVLDGAVVVFDGKQGVEPQSETVWRQADTYNVPRLCFVNKLNLIGGDFLRSLESIRKRLYASAAPVQLPIGKEHDYHGWIDLVSQKAYVYADEEGMEEKEVEIPAGQKELVKKYRNQLIEAVADYSDTVLEKFVEGNAVEEEELHKAVREATLSGDFFPVLGGDGRKAVVKSLLDAITRYLPTPLDMPPVEGINPETGEKETREADYDAPFAALAFKVQTDPYVGRLTYFRVYSGQLSAGSYVLNASKEERERMGRIILMHANMREEIDEVSAGEIGASVGLKNTFTGDTLCNAARPIILEDIKFPDPVISVAIEPKTKVDQEKLSQALQKLAEEDPTFQIKVNHETGQTIISGMGELHLEILVERMKREFNVEANVGRPQVAYRETIRTAVEQEGKYIRQTGGHGQYGHVFIRLEPLERGEGYQFVDGIKGGAIPHEFIPSVEKGVKEAMESGVMAGYPVTDVEVTLFDGSYHDVDSSDIAYKIAASGAFKEGMKKANPVLLEPMMQVVVTVPDKYVGEVSGDLSSRRAQIEAMEQQDNVRIVKAVAPLADMFGYSTALRSLTQGRASFNMEPSHYEEVPQNILEKIVGSSGE